MLMIFAIAMLLFFSACTASKINRSNTKTTETQTKQTNQDETTNSKSFDFSIHTQDDFRLTYLPIDPQKEMGVSTDPTTGETKWVNAIPVYEKSNKQTNIHKTEESTQAKTTTTNEVQEATTDETTKQKIKISVPWYAFAFLGFFVFATIISLVVINKLSKTLSAFGGAIAGIEKRLKTLEQ